VTRGPGGKAAWREADFERAWKAWLASGTDDDPRLAFALVEARVPSAPYSAKEASATFVLGYLTALDESSRVAASKKPTSKPPRARRGK
jgi:hypothetical protein